MTDGSNGDAGRGVSTIPNDSLGAFCQDNHIALNAVGSGPLDGLTFAAKDVMDIAGAHTGFGQPTWLATHAASTANAAAVQRLLNAGARLLGKTVSDELSYSLTGENVHYGAPSNPAAPDRVAGGSSSGSVSAVAGGLVDLSLGTDCAGSVRLPASYCGVWGMRPTHNHVPTDGVIPFAPSFDTVGWFARDPGILKATGRALLGEHYQQLAPRRMLIARDCFNLVDPGIRHALAPALERAQAQFTEVETVTVSASGLEPFMECFRVIQGAEIWNSLGAWITEHQPQLGPGIVDRVEAARRVSNEEVAVARSNHQPIVESLQRLVQPGDVLVLPSSPRVAPKKNTATSTVEVTYRYQAICLLSIAGLGGLPEISMPLSQLDGLPLGLSIVGAAGTDAMLLELACRIGAS